MTALHLSLDVLLENIAPSLTQLPIKRQTVWFIFLDNDSVYKTWLHAFETKSKIHNRSTHGVTK